MATQVLYPDALITQTGLTGSVLDIDDDPDTSASDTDYLSSNGATVCTMVASFPTPSGNPTTGTGMQNFRFRARITGSGGAPQTLTWRLYDDSNTTLQTGTVSITSTSFATYTVGWDAANLTVADGSSVRIYLSGGYAGNPTFSRWSWEISALEWNVDYTSAGVSVALSGSAATGTSGSIGALRQASLSGAAGVASYGALVAARSAALSGSAATASTGSVAVFRSVPLSGAESVATSGAITAARSVTLAGSDGIAYAGTLTSSVVSDVSVALSGASATAAHGTVIALRSAELSGARQYCAITLSSSLSASDLTDYTAWITAESVSDAALNAIRRHARADLNDVRFSLDAAGDQLLALYKIHVNLALGQFVFLVGPMDYTGATAKTIYMHWGGADLTTDTSSSAVFPSNVVAAWSPLDTSNLADLSGNAHTLTAVGTIGTDASHPSGARAYKPDSLNAYLATTGQDFGGICNTQSCSIETLCKHYSDNAGWMASVANPAVTAYWGQYYAVTGQVYYEISRPGGSIATSTPITSGQSAEWAYWGAVYNDAAQQVSGRLFGVPLAPVTVPAINTTMTDAALLQNTGTLNALDAAVALAIVRNVALSSDWMQASDRLANDQATYVTWDASVVERPQIEAAAGTLVASRSASISGSVSSVSAGIITAMRQAALSGQAGVTITGTLAAERSAGLTGASVSALSGILSTEEAVSVGLTGSALVASSGSLTAVRAVGLTGQVAAASSGIVQALREAAITGSLVAVSAGTLRTSAGELGYIEGEPSITVAILADGVRFTVAVDGDDLATVPAISGDSAEISP